MSVRMCEGVSVCLCVAGSVEQLCGRRVTVSRGGCAGFLSSPLYGSGWGAHGPSCWTGEWGGLGEGESSLYLDRKSFMGRLGSERCQELGDAA